MPVLVDCPICAHDDLAPYAMRHRANYPHIARARCRACGAVFANPMATDAELQQFYGGYYDRGNFADQRYKSEVAKQYAEMRATDPDGLRSPFYVRPGGGQGSGRGMWARPLAHVRVVRGCRCHGTEYDRDAIAFCQGFLPGARIFNGSLLDARYTRRLVRHRGVQSRDRACHAASLVHAGIRRILRPGGTLVVATPNIGNWGTLYRTLMFLSGRIPSVGGRSGTYGGVHVPLLADLWKRRFPGDRTRS